ncbi:M48 family metallopeptidase [bacterium]|jgi:heat shock protein HtpX|nr:M48 family metallopeptidase [bacterium]MBT4649288.1 M48 family metallopeptidase [bacterium]
MYKEISQNKRKTWALMLIFIIVIAGLAWAWSQYSGGSSMIVAAAVIFASLMSLISFFAGDKVALTQSGAKEIKKKDNPYVWRLVENLSITAGLPMPKVYIIEDAHMNAFATGRDPKHASVAMTTGIINNLENEELEGVIAHELSHVKNYDIRLMMIVIVCIGIITLLSDWMLRSFIWGGRGRSSNNKGNGAMIIVGLVLAILSPIFARLIQLAVSRKREFLADASGALLTRYPEGLARALEKISQQQAPLRRANKATAHLYFSNPFSDKKVKKMFSTHPPAADRINALRNM